jgi:hypothetical protein
MSSIIESSDTDEYNIDNYSTPELLIMLKNFFNLDLTYIRTKQNLINTLNTSLNNYKLLNTNKTSVTNFISKIITRLSTLTNIEILLNDLNFENEAEIQNQQNQQDQQNQSDNETLIKLYKLFNIEIGNLSLEELDISYDELKKKANININEIVELAPVSAPA